MQKKLQTGLAGVFVFTLALQLFHSPARAADAQSAAALTEMVKPYLRFDTCVISHVDLARMDMKALHAHLGERLANATLAPADKKDAQDAFDEAMAVAETWTDAMLKAGGRHVFQIVTYTPNGGDAVEIASLEPGANARAVQGLMMSGKADGDTSNIKAWGTNPNRQQYARQAEVIDNAVVMGTRTRIDRAAQGKAANRPEVADAINAVGDDSAACVLIVPTEDARAGTEKGVGKTLPPFLGGGPVTDLTRGVQWIAISAHQSPAMSLLAIAQCKDEATAKTDNNTLATAIRFLTIMPASEDQPNWGLIVAGITPAVEGSQVKVALDAASIDMRLPQFASVISFDRRQIQMGMSQSNLRQIAMGGIMYAQKHKNAWPDDLNALVAASQNRVNASILKNPRRPDLDIGYAYLKPTPESLTKNPSKTMVVHEIVDDKAKTVGVAFADGHAEQMPRAAYEQALTEILGAAEGGGL